MTTNATYSKLLLSGLLVLPLAMMAQDAETTSDQKEEVKTEDILKEFEFGGYFLSDDSFRFGKYTGLTDEGAEVLFNFRRNSV